MADAFHASLVSVAAGGSSGISHGKLEEPDHSSSNWYFTREETERSSPSRMDGIDLKKESYLRKSYCTFLQDLGMRLKVPQVTIATSIVLCHRFFIRQSHHKNDRYMIATVCMFLAGKVEETPKPLRDVILISYEIRYKKDPVAVQRIKQKEVYEVQKERILIGEHLVLTTLGFDLNIHHPYKPLVAAIKKFKVAQNALAQVAWNFVNDGLRTSLCLQFKPHHIAAGAIFLAAKFLKVKLPSDGEKVWWQEFEVTPRQLEEVSNQMLELYEQNREPLGSRSSDPGGSTDANNWNKAGSLPRTVGEAEPSANGCSSLLQQSSPNSAVALSEKAVFRSDITLREDDRQVATLQVCASSAEVKPMNSLVETDKQQVHEAGPASFKKYMYVTKPTANGPVRREDDKQLSLRNVSSSTWFRESDGVLEATMEQVDGVLVQHAPVHLKSTLNRIVKQEMEFRHASEGDMVTHEVKDCEGDMCLLKDAGVKGEKALVGSAWIGNEPKNKLDAGSIQRKVKHELQYENLPSGDVHERGYSKGEASLEDVEIENKVIVGTKMQRRVDDNTSKKTWVGVGEANTHHLKAALEKRHRFQGEGGDARSLITKSEVTDGGELLVREQESGVEAAAESERAKQGRREWTAKLFERVGHDGLESKGERIGGEVAIRRKRMNEEIYTEPYERNGLLDGDNEKFKELLYSEEGKLLNATMQDQVWLPRMEGRNQPCGSPIKRCGYGSHDQPVNRDRVIDNKYHHSSYDHSYSHQYLHRFDSERDDHHYKDKDFQEREHKKSCYDRMN
eukprot:c28154_g1_i3 orf=483-2852(-)